MSGTYRTVPRSGSALPVATTTWPGSGRARAYTTTCSSLNAAVPAWAGAWIGPRMDCR